MEPNDRQQTPMRLFDDEWLSERRSQILASVGIDVDLLRKNERDHAPDELSDEEADAFGCC